MKPAFELVFFDVDSTLVSIEGIDELAPGDPEIARLTEAAMAGEIPLEQVYGLRLERIRPTREKIDWLARRYLETVVQGAREVIARLTEATVDVHLVTAGIEQAILPLAESLGIEPRAVHAVRLMFAEDGSWTGFDSASPLTRAGGKELVVLNVRARTHGSAAFVGDGVTDLETKGAVDRMIGFGGVSRRERVAREADVWVDGPGLDSVLPYLVEERR